MIDELIVEIGTTVTPRIERSTWAGAPEIEGPDLDVAGPADVGGKGRADDASMRLVTGRPGTDTRRRQRGRRTASKGVREIATRDLDLERYVSVARIGGPPDSR